VPPPKLLRDDTGKKPKLVFEQAEEKPRQTLVHGPLVAEKGTSSFKLNQPDKLDRKDKQADQKRARRVSEFSQEESGWSAGLRRLGIDRGFAAPKPEDESGIKGIAGLALAVGAATPIGTVAMILVATISIFLFMSSLRFAFGFKDPNAETANLMAYFTQEAAGLVWNYVSLDGGRYFPGYGGSLDSVRVSTNYDQSGQTQYKRQVELMGLIFAKSLAGVDIPEAKRMIAEIVEELYWVTYTVENWPYYTEESSLEEVDGVMEEVTHLVMHDYYVLSAYVSEGDFSSLVQSRLDSISDPEEKELAEVRMDFFKENLGLEQFIANPLGPGDIDWRDLITSATGYRLLYGGLEMHNGLDLGVPEGTPIYAAGSGEVTSAGYNSSSGNFIELAVKDGGSDTVFVTYMHLASTEARTGQAVAEGQVIGLSGNTGRSTGPHLHIQAAKDGNVLNPLFLIRLPGKD
jgi:hypothetical protein